MGLSMKINGISFEKFDLINFSKALDSIASTFSFSIYFDKDNEEKRSIFTPLSYHLVEIFDDQKLVLTGTFLNHAFVSDENTNLVSVSGYSKCGILEDCSIPRQLYPLESLNKSLSEICNKIFKYFDIKFVVDPSVQKDMNLIFKKSIAGEDESVKDYIAKLAAQRNIVLGHNEKGEVVFFRPSEKSQVKMQLTKENTLKMGLNANGQNMHHTLMVLRQPTMPRGRKTEGTDKKKPNLKFYDSINNPLVLNTKRNTVKVMTSGEDVDTVKAVQNLRADQMKNISIDVSFENWVDLNCGDVVDVINPEIFIYTPTKFMVGSVSKTEDTQSKTMNISLNPPEAYTGGEIKKIW